MVAGGWPERSPGRAIGVGEIRGFRGALGVTLVAFRRDFG